MKIWVDADACPKAIKELLYRVAVRTQFGDARWGWAHHAVVLVTQLTCPAARLPVPPETSSICTLVLTEWSSGPGGRSGLMTGARTSQ